jgi:hypothetical protein
MHPCLFYADDALFFFIKPELQQIQILNIALTALQSISGLIISMKKSELTISRESDSVTQQLADVLNCKKGTFPITYLGLPLFDKRLSRSAYISLLNKFSQRLSGWAAKHLSMTGRVALINAILSSLPTYFMSIFELPL